MRYGHMSLSEFESTEEDELIRLGERIEELRRRDEGLAMKVFGQGVAAIVRSGRL